jgi:hypothetical protein
MLSLMIYLCLGSPHALWWVMLVRVMDVWNMWGRTSPTCHPRLLILRISSTLLLYLTHNFWGIIFNWFSIFPFSICKKGFLLPFQKSPNIYAIAHTLCLEVTTYKTIIPWRYYWPQGHWIYEQRLRNDDELFGHAPCHRWHLQLLSIFELGSLKVLKKHILKSQDQHFLPLARSRSIKKIMLLLLNITNYANDGYPHFVLLTNVGFKIDVG